MKGKSFTGIRAFLSTTSNYKQGGGFLGLTDEDGKKLVALRGAKYIPVGDNDKFDARYSESEVLFNSGTVVRYHGSDNGYILGNLEDL